MGERRLVVVADDLGLTLETSRSIVRAHLDGVVTATSVMGNGRSTGRSMRLLAGEPTLGWACTPCSWAKTRRCSAHRRFRPLSGIAATWPRRGARSSLDSSPDGWTRRTSGARSQLSSRSFGPALDR